MRHPQAPRSASPAAGRGPRGAADARRAVGRRGEQLAAQHLRSIGFRVLDRNVRTRRGEIDLIAFDGDTLVFVEVKTRRVRLRGQRLRPDQEPLAGLRARQRARIRGLAAEWLADSRTSRPRARTLRFDAIGVLIDGAGRRTGLEHIEGAW